MKYATGQRVRAALWLFLLVCAAIVGLVLLTGCASTAEMQLIEDNISHLEGRIANSENLSEFEKVQLQHEIDAWRDKLAELRATGITGVDPNVLVGTGDLSQLIGRLVGGPWGLALTAIGGLIVGDRNRNRVGTRTLKNVVMSVERARTGPSVDWGKVAEIQDAIGVRNLVRRTKDEA